MLFTDVITVYNYHRDTDTKTDKWSRHVLKGVMWKPQIIKNVSADGKLNMATTVSVTIPKMEGYVVPKEYAKLTSSEKTLKWTLNAHNNLDIIVLGDCSLEIASIKEFRQSVVDIVTIAEVRDNTNRTYNKHWKVVCR